MDKRILTGSRSDGLFEEGIPKVRSIKEKMKEKSLVDIRYNNRRITEQVSGTDSRKAFIYKTSRLFILEGG